jgi:hypothetical protein
MLGERNTVVHRRVLIAYNLAICGGGWRGVAGCQLVAHQLAAAVGEDRRTAHPTCALLLVAIGRKPSDAAAVRGHAGEDRDAAVADGIK